jgi:hypothetical protein
VSLARGGMGVLGSVAHFALAKKRLLDEVDLAGLTSDVVSACTATCTVVLKPRELNKGVAWIGQGYVAVKGEPGEQLLHCPWSRWPVVKVGPTLASDLPVTVGAQTVDFDLFGSGLDEL